MIGHRVIVYYKDGKTFEGILIDMTNAGVFVHNTYGLNDTRLFIPMGNIEEIIDKGRS